MSTVYSATISGTPTLSIPISTVSLRLRETDDSYASVTIPWTTDLATEIASRDAEDLSIYRDGELIATVDIDYIRSDIGITRASITVSGHRVISWGTPGSYTLQDINYYSSTNSFRCAVENNKDIRPGDTISSPNGSFTAGVITINASARGENLQVSET
jgi:hypothetical protein